MIRLGGQNFYLPRLKQGIRYNIIRIFKQF